MPTARRSAKEQATPPVAPIRMMNGVGGTSIHYTGQSWRFSPYTFNERSETIRRYGRGAIPDGVALADWPLDYADLEPYYDRVEYTLGISAGPATCRGRRTREATSSRAAAGGRTPCRRCAAPATTTS